MKLIAVIAGMLITGGIIFTPSTRSLKGTWLIESAQPECSSKVLRIQMHQGIWKGTVDFPAVRKYDQKIHSVQVKKETVEILLNEDDRIVGEWVNDSLITATFSKGSEHTEVELKKQ